MTERQNREQSVSFKLTSKQFEDLGARASEAGLSPSIYARTIILFCLDNGIPEEGARLRDDVAASLAVILRNLLEDVSAEQAEEFVARIRSGG